MLDEYDTPLQEAWVYGYWYEMVELMRGLFNSIFKANPYLERAVMTGITRVSKESIFSDLNHLTVVTSTSEMYADCFGFTEQEVYSALDEYGMQDRCADVKRWYDGFTFGKCRDIYNPWSILNKEIDEQIIFNQLDVDENAIWSLFLASGYVKAESYTLNEETGGDLYELALTNKEVHVMFQKMIRKWFSSTGMVYNGFVKALLQGDVKSMNAYINRVALATFSYFDSGRNPSMETQPERFYHGFVLGLAVELADRYIITSNRESGFGRYDVMMEPKNKMDNAAIIEFKVRDSGEEKSLEDTADVALRQIEEQRYETELENRGILGDQIRKYAFAFEGKEVLIKRG